MLSRVAESLYWAARHIERAEIMSRLLYVNFHTLLDADTAEHEQAWRRLLALGGSETLFFELFDGVDADAMSEFVLWKPENPDAVVTCVAQARENVRGVRDQISSEMWEELNRLHLQLAPERRRSIGRTQHDLFVRVRQTSHELKGTMRSTLPRGEAYDFLELGAYVERADMAARILAVESPALTKLPADSREESIRLSALLRSCGAFEAFRKEERTLMRASRVLEYLLLDARCPRTVFFCLDASLQCLKRIPGNSDQAQRAVGRLVSDLSFLDLSELHRHRPAPLLTRIQAGIEQASNEIAATYFTTRVLVPGAYAHAHAHAQQQ
jgi:uncharacterized alpha-E superfamily protein